MQTPIRRNRPSQHAAAPRAAWRGRNSGPRVSLPGHRGARPAAGRTLPAAPARGEGGARRSHTLIGMSWWVLGHTSAAARRDRVLGPYLVGTLRVVRHRVWRCAEGVNSEAPWCEYVVAEGVSGRGGALVMPLGHPGRGGPQGRR